jgi:putative phosphoribosyl transferase
VGHLVLAVPICAAQTADVLSAISDAIICVLRTHNLNAVGLWYDNFDQTSDQEVEQLLALADGHIEELSDRPDPPANLSRPVSIQVGDSWIDGDLNVPPEARGIVLFAHGSGSSRHSERNRQVARVLNEAMFGTLLIDLLTPQEEASAQLDALKFDIPLLAGRLVHAIDWLGGDRVTNLMPVGLFGASTGAAAALLAAVERSSAVRAVVSRGGRPDLAGQVALAQGTAPTLLIVGEVDYVVLELNKQAMSEMQASQVRLEIIPGATHLFPEPGALHAVSRLAVDWFNRHLT